MTAMTFEQLQSSWNEIKEDIRNLYQISDVSYNTWIRDMKPDSMTNNTLIVCIPSDNSLMLSYYEKKYREPIQAVVSERMNCPIEILFVLNDGKKTEEQKEDIQKKSELNIRADEANLNSKYRFETFVIGNNNRYARSACLAVAESPGTVYNPLFLYGDAGLGKTHLMHSIGHYIIEANPDMKVLYVTSEQFTNEVIESIRTGNADAQSMPKLRNKYRTVDVLLIDDIQFIIGRASTQEEFFHTFNELHAAGKQIVISSDRPPKEMEALNERFRSRFEMGLIADVQPPDYETRMAILRSNAKNQQLKIDDKILEYIASNIKSNIRELEGALNKIIAYSKLNNVEINLTMAQEVLKDIIYPNADRIITPRMIADIVCEHYGVKLSMVASRKKNTECVIPRHVIMYLCREYTDATLDSIAQLLNKKDHSTVMHGVDKIRDEMETNEELRNNVNLIKKKLNLT